MTTPELPPNQYQEAGFPVNALPDPAVARRGRRPGGLTFVCVVAIVLGGLGLLGALSGMASLVFGSAMQDAFTVRQPGMGDDVMDTQIEIQKRLQAVTNRYWEFHLGFSLVHLVVAGSLLAGGILALRSSPSGCRLLVTVFVVAIIFELSRAVFQVTVQIDMLAAVSDAISRRAEAPTNDGGPGGDFLATIMKASFFVGIGLTACFALAKVIFYGVGARYLSRLQIQSSSGEPCRDGLG
jgi:hypothetical protein